MFCVLCKILYKIVNVEIKYKNKSCLFYNKNQTAELKKKLFLAKTTLLVMSADNNKIK